MKYECVYLSAFKGGGEARREIGAWIERYNQKRPHSSLDDKTPFEAYRGLPLPGAGTLEKAV
ncbi:MAG: integrase core domain-containing protein [Nitrospinota bacterium]